MKARFQRKTWALTDFADITSWVPELELLQGL